MLPRPEITDQLGIRYRRIPILAIGNDVYCDTRSRPLCCQRNIPISHSTPLPHHTFSIIVSALERRFPASSGYGTLFPAAAQGGGLGVGTGLIKAFAKFYAEATVSRQLVALVPFDGFTPEFMKDREDVSRLHIHLHIRIEKHC